MQEENVADVKMEGEDGGLSYKRKYKEMKQKVKYLAYEHECFQLDLQKAQEKLLQLAKDKNCLLDQLLRYETVMLSDDDEQTDYSTDEDEEVDTPFFNPQRTETNSRSLHSNQKASPKSTQPKQGGKPSQAASPKIVETPTSGTKRQQKGSVGGSGSQLSTAAKIAKTVAKAHTIAPPKLTQPQLQPQPQPQPQPGPLVVSLPLGQLVPKVKHQPAAAPTVPPLLSQQLPSDLPPPPPLSSHGTTNAHKPASSSSSSSSSSESDSSSESSSSSDEGTEQPSGPVPMMSAVHSNIAAKGVGQLVRPKALTSPNNPPPPPKLIFVGDGPIPALTHSSSPPPLQPQPQLQQQPGVFTWSNRQQQETPAAVGPPGFTPIVPTLSSPTFNKPFPGSAFHVVSPKFDSKPSSIAL